MSTNRKLWGAAAFAVALAGGGVAGAMLGTPGLSTAQDSPGTTESAPRAEHPGRGKHRGEHLATAAEALGISEDELRTALEGGQSIAQVAKAQGVEAQTVIDALVAEATARLEAAIGELPDRMTEIVNHEGLPGGGDRGGPGRPGGPLGPRREALETVAQALGISTEELHTALKDGSSLAQVAAANDVDVQTVIDALVAEATAHLDEAVADGRLTEDEATEQKAQLEERITARVNGEHPEGGPPQAAADA